VLPLTLAGKLGFDRKDLEERDMQTANGKVTASYATLSGLWLGEVRIGDVAAAFIEDEKLGGNGLLGMSVLGRYKVTIDDENSRLTLGGKQAGATAREAADGAGDPGGKTP
jgi:predicted aspartyl protease